VDERFTFRLDSQPQKLDINCIAWADRLLRLNQQLLAADRNAYAVDCSDLSIPPCVARS